MLFAHCNILYDHVIYFIKNFESILITKALAILVHSNETKNANKGQNYQSLLSSSFGCSVYNLLGHTQVKFCLGSFTFFGSLVAIKVKTLQSMCLDCSLIYLQ